MIVRAGDFLKERFYVHDLEVERSEGAHARHAEVRVAQHHRVARAPLVAGEKPRIDEVNVRLERRFEAVLPTFERGKDRDVIRDERVFARPERVAELAEVNELRGL